jgi:hypothetical protein
MSCGSSDCNKMAAEQASAEATLLAFILEVVCGLTGGSGVCPVIQDKYRD